MFTYVIKTTMSSHTFTETFFNADILRTLCSVDTNAYHDSDLLDSVVQHQIKSIVHKIGRTNSQTVSYSTKEKGVGRYWSSSVGMQKLDKRVLRLAAGSNAYFGIDIVNCQPVILEQICAKVNVPTPCLSQYNARRDTILQATMTDFNVTRKDAKKLFLMIMMGGSFDSWKDTLEIENNQHGREARAFAANLSLELCSIKTQAMDTFPFPFDKCFKMAKKNHPHKSTGAVLSSALALFLQSEERRIMDLVIEFAECRQFQPAVHKFDEVLFYFKKQAKFPSMFELEEFVHARSGFVVTFTNEMLSPTPEDQAWFERHKEFIFNSPRSDQVHCDRLLQQFNGQFYSNYGVPIMYLSNEGYWTENESLMMAEISSFADIIFINVTKADQNKNFQQLFKPAFALAKSRAPPLQNANLAFLANRGYLLFSNGVLEMATKTLLPFDPKYFFTFTINRSFEVCEDQMKKQIISKIFDNPIAATAKRDYVLEVLARGVAGELSDKEFMMLIGMSNCGKGKITTLALNALGPFATSFDAKNLIGTRSGLENEKNNAWIINIYNRRLAIANEIEMAPERVANNFGGSTTTTKKMNSNTIKVLASGGDLIPIRDLHVKHTESIKVPNVAKIIILVNDSPEMDGQDGITERARYVAFDRTSSDKVNTVTATRFPKDSSIDDFVQTPAVHNAFINLMCDYYENSLTQGRMDIPDSVKQEVSIRTGANDSGTEWILSKYEVCPVDTIVKFDGQQTLNKPGCYQFDWEKVKDWFVIFDTIHQYYNNDVACTSNQNFSRILSEIKHVYKSYRKINGRTRLVVVGLKKPNRDNDFFD